MLASITFNLLLMPVICTRRDDSIHFCTFKTVWNEALNTWRLEFDKRMSTNTEGIRKILGGASEERFLTVDEFKGNISTRLALDL